MILDQLFGSGVRRFTGADARPLRASPGSDGVQGNGPTRGSPASAKRALGVGGAEGDARSTSQRKPVQMWALSASEMPMAPVTGSITTQTTANVTLSGPGGTGM